MRPSEAWMPMRAPMDGFTACLSERYLALGWTVDKALKKFFIFCVVKRLLTTRLGVRGKNSWGLNEGKLCANHRDAKICVSMSVVFNQLA